MELLQVTMSSVELLLMGLWLLLLLGGSIVLIGWVLTGELIPLLE